MVTDDPRRYRLLEKLGEGGYGAVYRAEMSGPAGFTKPVAIKLLHEGLETTPEVIQRFRDEARILGLVRHPAIVAVDSLTRFARGWAVIMEYVPGVDLNAPLEDGPLPPRVALSIVEEVASALHLVHEQATDAEGNPLHILHRDIKPSNIRITALGEVKVLDFGVARGQFAQREARTSSHVLGSFKYMPIERLEGVEGPGTDIYALGLVLLEIMTGPLPDEPPRHPERYRAFVAERVEQACALVQPSLVRGGLRTLLNEMASYEAEVRPSAQDVERRCRRLGEIVEGPRIRDWAREAIPLLQERQAPTVPSATHSLVLEEQTEPPAGQRLPLSAPTLVPGAPTRDDLPLPAPSAARARRRWPLAVGLLAGAAVAVLLGLYLRSLAPAPAPPSPPLLTLANALSPAPPPGDEQVASHQPAPATPEPKAVPETKPKPKPKPVPQAETIPDAVADNPTDPPPVTPMAQVEVSGDARDVWFRADGQQRPAGVLPPGDWTILAWFDGPEPVVAGTISLHDGEKAQVRCVSSMAKCVKVR